MGSYSLFIKPSAVKEIEEIPRKSRILIVRRIRDLASDPRPHGCQKLAVEGKYRLRQGRYRIVYSISDRELTVLVVKVAHRREVYRALF